MEASDDPRVATKRVEFPKPPKKEETDPMGDGYLSMSTVASSVGLFMRQRYFCYAGVALCLLSLANRRVDTFSWSSFVTGLILGIVGVAATLMQEMQPGAKDAAAAGDAAAAALDPTPAPAASSWAGED